MLTPWNVRSYDLPPDPQQKRHALAVELGQLLRPRAEDMLEVFLKQSGSIRRLGERNQHVVFKAFLFVEAGRWSARTRQSFGALLDEAALEEAAYANAKEFAELLVRALNYQAFEISSASAELLLKDEKLLRGLWTALCNRELLLSGVVWLLAAREKFILKGADSLCMPLCASWTQDLAYFRRTTTIS